MVVGALFFIKYSSKQSEADELHDRCAAAPMGCTDANKATVKSLDEDAAGKGTIAVIGFAAGGVALAAGVTLLVVGKPRPKSPSATVTPWFSGEMGGLQGTF